jgi:hypothetical protein
MSIINSFDYPMVTVGIKEQKKVKVYPLSFADARKLKALILSLIQGVSELKKDEFDAIQIGSFVASVIEENIGIIIKMVLSEPVEEEELSLEQVSEIANLIVSMNENAIKNFMGLWKKFRKEQEPKAKNQ